MKRKLIEESSIFNSTDKSDGVFSHVVEKPGVNINRELQTEAKPIPCDIKSLPCPKYGSDFNNPLGCGKVMASDDINKNVFSQHSQHVNILGKKFAQEFHDSVLQSTRMKELHKPNGKIFLLT